VEKILPYQPRKKGSQSTIPRATRGKDRRKKKTAYRERGKDKREPNPRKPGSLYSHSLLPSSRLAPENTKNKKGPKEIEKKSNEREKAQESRKIAKIHAIPLRRGKKKKRRTHKSDIFGEGGEREIRDGSKKA